MKRTVRGNGAVRRVQRALPTLAAIVRDVHREEPTVVQVMAVTAAWAGLAGLAGWTPGMVTSAERAVRRARG